MFSCIYSSSIEEKWMSPREWYSGVVWVHFLSITLGIYPWECQLNCHNIFWFLFYMNKVSLWLKFKDEKEKFSESCFYKRVSYSNLDCSLIITFFGEHFLLDKMQQFSFRRVNSLAGMITNDEIFVVSSAHSNMAQRHCSFYWYFWS